MKSIPILLLVVLLSCQPSKTSTDRIITSDISHFWEAFDLITMETDTLKQLAILDSLFIQKSSTGQKIMMESRNYTPEEYIDLINNKPKFWNSIRPNTLKAQQLAEDLNEGIEKLKIIYPDIRPATIYFTMGCMRSNGTTRDSMIFIGSELALADSKIDISEFEGRTHEWLQNYFGSEPLDALVLLNVHEYVHTQQHPMPDNLPHICLYEGVAEFTSVTAMGLPSEAPAIEFGKNNTAVREKFENEMFWERTGDWLWSNAPNEFNVRDLGYHIGYELAEIHYTNAEDKKAAIKELIELDYSDTERIDKVIDDTGFFTKPLNQIKTEDEKRRPSISSIKEFDNNSMNVDPNLKQITFNFSEKLNGYNTGLNYSDKGEHYFPQLTKHAWSADSLSWTMDVELEKDKFYEFYVTANFRRADGVPILPYLVSFKTGS